MLPRDCQYVSSSEDGTELSLLELLVRVESEMRDGVLNVVDVLARSSSEESRDSGGGCGEGDSTRSPNRKACCRCGTGRVDEVDSLRIGKRVSDMIACNRDAEQVVGVMKATKF